MDYRVYYREDKTFQRYLEKPLTRPLMSGHEYMKLCKFNLCSRYEINFDDELVKEGDLVFLGGGKDAIRDHIERLFLNTPKHKFKVIVGNTDESFDDEDAYLLEPYVSQIWAINNVSSSPLVRSIPLGFSDNAGANAVDDLDWAYYSGLGVWEHEKTKLVICKFWRNFYRPGREECFNFFWKQPWATCFVENDWTDTPTYLDEIKEYKYQVCPTGAGLDTHRFYESILCDTIPIIKLCPITPFLSQFPCLIVEEWEDIDGKFLEDKYDELYEQLKTWKEENPNWLLAKNYIK